ncbi:MAG TPA: TrmH family RNA methyltransferase [Gemmatimonadales bacterium]|jgi:tRNA (cytidine/uridine-2'-O-)-methyltransferase|nr:TrmH family RNA methyltransferase [Gemmatimonadales bacterium]
MPLHIALLEARTPATVGAIASKCAAVDASLHLIGPLSFAVTDPEFRSSGPADWDALDWWLHPGWRDFRDAMSRERCLYFAADGERDPVEAPFRPNSVLVFGDETLGLPDRIRGKYPDRVFALPRAAQRKRSDPAAAIEATLAFAAKRAAPAPAGRGPRLRAGRRSD